MHGSDVVGVVLDVDVEVNVDDLVVTCFSATPIFLFCPVITCHEICGNSVCGC